MKNSKIITFFVFTVIAINSFIIVDYIQKSVNSHTANADYCAIALLFLALFLCLFSLISFLNRKRNEVVYFLFLFGITIILWLPNIFSIQCKGCTIA